MVRHRVSVASSPEVSSELADLGVAVAFSGLVTFEVEESSPTWPRLRDWIARRGAVDVPTTTFSKGELDGARWLELVSDWHHGYPQPDEGTFGYLRATYDLSDYCPACGVGLNQTAPFQMTKEPRWGRKRILQLNWVFDEFFVTPEVWSSVFEPLGVGSRPVVGPRLETLETVVQLVVIGEVDVETANLASTVCKGCGRTKFDAPTAGFSPAPRIGAPVSGRMVKSRQWFGSGSRAFHEVLVTQEIRRALLAERVLGASLRPCE